MANTEHAAAFKAFMEAYDAAGYVDEDDEMLAAFDAGPDWIFVSEDSHHGGYMVGRFTKPTRTKNGDFFGDPLAEGIEKVEALRLAEFLAGGNNDL